MKHDIAETLITARDPAGNQLALVALSGGGCGIAMNDQVLPDYRFSTDQADHCADAFLCCVAPAAWAQPLVVADPPASLSLAESSHDLVAHAMRKSEAMRARARAMQTRLRELGTLRAAAGDDDEAVPRRKQL